MANSTNLDIFYAVCLVVFDPAMFIVFVHDKCVNEGTDIKIVNVALLGSCDAPDLAPTWEFATNLSYEEITKVMMECHYKDIHIMFQSLKPVDQYNGVRDNPHCR